VVAVSYYRSIISSIGSARIIAEGNSRSGSNVRRYRIVAVVVIYIDRE
jgi:hypothetical protein